MAYSSEEVSGRKAGRFYLSAAGLIFLAGFIIRIYFLIRYGNELSLNSDDMGYVDSADKLLSWGILTYGEKTPTVYIMPGYPLFLSFFIGLLGREAGLIAVRLVQIAANLTGCYFVYLTALRLEVKRPYALAGAAAIVFYPPSIITPNLLLTETLYTTLSLIGVYLSLGFLSRPSLKTAALLGAVFALAIQFRPVAALVPLFVCLLLLLRRTGDALFTKLKLCAVWLAVLVLLISPWWIRNYLLFDSFIPLTRSSGNPLLYGSYINYEGIEGGWREDWPLGRDRLESDRLHREMAVERIKQGFGNDFEAYFKWYTAGKAKRMWKRPFNWYHTAEMSDRLQLNYHYFLLLTGSAGILAAVCKRSFKGIVLALFIVYNTAAYMVFVTNERYCYPQMFIVAVFAGYFLELLSAGVRTGVRKLGL